MSHLIPSAAVVGTRPEISETALLLERSTAFDLAATVDLGRSDDHAWKDLLASRGIDLVVLDGHGPDRLRLVRQLHAANKAVLLSEPFPLTPGELDQLLRLEAAGGRPIGVLAPHRALLGEETTELARSPFACGILEISVYRPVEAHRWARWAPLAESPATQAALRAAAPYLDMVCQVLGKPTTVVSLGPDNGTGVGIADFARGCRLAFAVTSQSASQVERLDLLGADSRLRIEGGRVFLEQDFGTRTTELPTLPSARELLLHEMANAIKAVGKLRYGSLAASRGLAMILGELSK